MTRQITYLNVNAWWRVVRVRAVRAWGKRKKRRGERDVIDAIQKPKAENDTTNETPPLGFISAQFL